MSDSRFDAQGGGAGNKYAGDGRRWEALNQADVPTAPVAAPPQAASSKDTGYKVWLDALMGR